MHAETVEPCIRGCLAHGKHLPACPCHGDTHAHADSQCPSCPGCAPRVADVGRLCQPCSGRITRALLDAPDLVGWIREQVTPGTWRGTRDDVLREAPAPLTVDAVADADDLHALLSAWAVAYADLTGLTGPSWGGSAIRPGSRRRIDLPGPHGLPSTRHVVYDDPRVVGLRADADHRDATHRVATWLLRHREGIAALDWAASWHDEVVDAIRGASSRWPRAPRQRKLPLPCPSCDQVMLWMHPPAGPPAYQDDGSLSWAYPISVCCHNDACGRVLTEGDYYLAVGNIRRQLAEKEPRRA